MIEKSSQCHQRYINIEENLDFTKQNGIEVLVSNGAFYKWSLYGHFDFPLETKELRDKSPIECKANYIYRM